MLVPQRLFKKITNSFLRRGSRRKKGACVGVLIGLVSALDPGGLLSQGHTTSAVLSALVSGLVSLIGWFVLVLVIHSLLKSFLICVVDRTVAQNDEGVVREPRVKVRWYVMGADPVDRPTQHLYLKEHSPPPFLSPAAPLAMIHRC